MARRGRRAALAAAVLLLCDVVGSALAQERCPDRGCCYNSRVTSLATQQNCSFSEPSTRIDLTTSPSLEDLIITQSSKVSLEGDAVGNTNKLRTLLFSNIQELTLEANSKVQVGAGRAVSLTVRGVGVLRLKTSAFLGWQSALATLSISDTGSVIIDEDAFPASSSFRRVRLSNITSLTLATRAIPGTIHQLELENIRSLQLMHNAIRGTLDTLSLQNVSAASCPPLAIGGSIGFVTLRSVTMAHLTAGCLNAGRRWSSLTLADCRLGHLSKRSIDGSIDDVTISGCRFASAETAAVSVKVRRLSVTTSTFGELGARALQVTATGSVTLHKVSVKHLSTDALSGLAISNTTSTSPTTDGGGGGGGGGISVSRLSVLHAEPGSLRFADGAPVTLKDLLLPGGCICSSPSWARQLLLGSSGGEDEPSSSADKRPPGGGRDSVSSSGGLATDRDTLLRQVEAALCTFGGDNISLSDFTASHCRSPACAGGQQQPAGHSAPLPSWWSYLGVVALTALLLAVAVLLAIAAARCRRQRQRKWPVGPEPDRATGRLCSSDGPTDTEEESSRYCAWNGGLAQPEVLYSELVNRLSEGGQRTASSPPVGGRLSEGGQRTASSPPAGGRLSEGGQRTASSPPAGGCQRETLAGTSAQSDGHSSTSTGLYAVSPLYGKAEECSWKAEECSCKSARLSEVEPAYANVSRVDDELSRHT